jgi:hypothetical protein
MAHAFHWRSAAADPMTCRSAAPTRRAGRYAVLLGALVAPAIIDSKFVALVLPPALVGINGPGTHPTSYGPTRRGAHRSVCQLNTDIREWIDTWNDDPKPYVWTKTTDQILESIARYCDRITRLSVPAQRIRERSQGRTFSHPARRSTTYREVLNYVSRGGQLRILFVHAGMRVVSELAARAKDFRFKPETLRTRKLRRGAELEAHFNPWGPQSRRG